MSVVKSNNRRGGGLATLNSLLATLLSPGALDSYRAAYEGGKSIGRLVSSPKAVDWSEPPGQNGGGGSGSGRRKGNNTRRRNGREKRQNPRNIDTFRAIGMGPTSGIPSLRTTVTGVYPVATNASGAFNDAMMIGFRNGVPSPLFMKLSADSQKLFGAFEKVLVHSVTMTYVGTQSSGAAGYVAMGMDSTTDMTPNAPNSITQLTDQATHTVICDVKGEASLTYKPKGSDKECRTSEASATAPEWYAGKFFMYLGGSNIVANQGFGLVRVSSDVTFIQ